VNNFLRIMSFAEDSLQRVSIVSTSKEAGISALFDPESENFRYRVFIHNAFPLITSEDWEFATFAEARSFAAKNFADASWEILEWDQQAKRPCSDGEHECGSGSCEMCKSTGGGCTSCGAQDDHFVKSNQ